MDGAEKKKQREKQKKWYSKKSCKVMEYRECLDYIILLDDNKALRNLTIYEAKLYCLIHLERFEEGLELIAGDHGHKKASLSFDTHLSEAICNFKCKNCEVAHTMFTKLDFKGRDEKTIKECNEYMKIILDEVGKELDAKAKENAKEFEKDFKADKPNSNADLSEQNEEELLEDEADKPTSTDLSGVVDGSSRTIALSCPVACSSTTEAFLFQKTP